MNENHSLMDARQTQIQLLQYDFIGTSCMLKFCQNYNWITHFHLIYCAKVVSPIECEKPSL
jgi:hypothetical protein